MKSINQIKEEITKMLDSFVKVYQRMNYHRNANPRWIILLLNGEEELTFYHTQCMEEQFVFDFSYEEVYALLDAYPKEKETDIHDAWFRAFRNEYFATNYPKIKF